MTFIDKLRTRWRDADTLLCVGLDPDPAKFPDRFVDDALDEDDDALFAFCRDIADATAEFACAFKPQIAYFAAHNGGEAALQRLIAHLNGSHPAIPVILDAKRGDRGCVFLCHTSNPGARDFQELDVGGEPLYQRIARTIANEWNADGNCALVVGATFPQELKVIRAIVGHMPLLIPGVGAQGGDVEAVVKNGRSADGTGLMINSSRGILYASQGEGFAEAAADAARELRDTINRWR